MILVKKFKFFHYLCLSKIDREKVFADVRDRQQAFKNYKNVCYKKNNNNFFKGVSSSFSSKIGDFLHVDFYSK